MIFARRHICLLGFYGASIFPAANDEETKKVELQSLLKPPRGLDQGDLADISFPSSLSEILCFGLPLQENDSKKIVDELNALVDLAREKRYSGVEATFLNQTKDLFFRNLALEISRTLHKYSNNDLAKAARYCFGSGKMVYTEIIIDILAERFILDHSLRAVELLESVFTHIGEFALIGKILIKARAAETFPIDAKKPDHINPLILSLRQTALLLEIHEKKGKGSRIDLSLEQEQTVSSFGVKAGLIIEIIKKHNSTILPVIGAVGSKLIGIGCCGAGGAAGIGVAKLCSCCGCAATSCRLL